MLPPWVWTVAHHEDHSDCHGFVSLLVLFPRSCLPCWGHPFYDVEEVDVDDMDEDVEQEDMVKD